jgi:hypothetical protein
MKKTRQPILLILLMFAYPAIGCMSTGFILQITPTATGTVIVAKENQTPGIPTDPPVDSKANCLKTAAGAVNVGDPCIVGTYSAHYDIVQRPNDHETIVTDSLMEAHLTLWAVAVGKLQGIAHITYSLKSKLDDPTSPTCQTSTSIVNSF